MEPTRKTAGGRHTSVPVARHAPAASGGPLTSLSHALGNEAFGRALGAGPPGGAARLARYKFRVPREGRDLDYPGDGYDADKAPNLTKVNQESGDKAVYADKPGGPAAVYPGHAKEHQTLVELGQRLIDFLVHRADLAIASGHHAYMIGLMEDLGDAKAAIEPMTRIVVSTSGTVEKSFSETLAAFAAVVKKSQPKMSIARVDELPADVERTVPGLQLRDKAPAPTPATAGPGPGPPLAEGARAPAGRPPPPLKCLERARAAMRQKEEEKRRRDEEGAAKKAAAIAARAAKEGSGAAPPKQARAPRAMPAEAKTVAAPAPGAQQAAKESLKDCAAKKLTLAVPPVGRRQPHQHLSELYYDPQGGNPMVVRGVRYHHRQRVPSCDDCMDNIPALHAAMEKHFSAIEEAAKTVQGSGPAFAPGRAQDVAPDPALAERAELHHDSELPKDLKPEDRSGLAEGFKAVESTVLGMKTRLHQHFQTRRTEALDRVWTVGRRNAGKRPKLHPDDQRALLADMTPHFDGLLTRLDNLEARLKDLNPHTGDPYLRLELSEPQLVAIDDEVDALDRALDQTPEWQAIAAMRIPQEAIDNPKAVRNTADAPAVASKQAPQEAPGPAANEPPKDE